jgi:hypothetical protein
VATWYVQHVDLTMDDMGEIDSGQALRMFGGADPQAQEHETVRPSDPLPLCIGFTRDAETFMEIAPGSGGYLVRISCRRPTKLLGLIPRKAVVEPIRDDVCRKELLEIIEAFFTSGEDQAMLLLRGRS